MEESIKRCEELIKPEKANWIGISNQEAIKDILEENRQLKEELKRYKRR